MQHGTKISLMSLTVDILALCETNLNKTYFDLTLIQKDSVTDMHDLAINEKEELCFELDLSLENCEDSYVFKTGFTSFDVSLLFPLLNTAFIVVHSF